MALPEVVSAAEWRRPGSGCWRTSMGSSDELATRLVLRTLARRASAATVEATELEREILVHVRALARNCSIKQESARLWHTVVLHRRQQDPVTKAYIARRIAEGKSRRDAVRLLKRYLARHLYRLLQQEPAHDLTSHRSIIPAHPRRER